MTVKSTISEFSDLAADKISHMNADPRGFLAASLMAGAYVGFGILLIFSVGQTADPSLRNLVMGASFGIALTLVIFAGSELYTGHTMYMTIGRLCGRVTTGEMFRAWGMTWGGNLLGSAALGLLFVAGGGGALLNGSGPALVHTIALKKMTAPGLELFCRAILCNWLVCLAIWCSARTRNDAAKCIVIFWCLYAFIATGFEHSVANMTLFSVALLSEHPDTIQIMGAARNLFWVTLGNMAGGVVFMGLGYWTAAGSPRRKTTKG